jgi:RimJ/RimL family protein N-acetyltransferase
MSDFAVVNSTRLSYRLMTLDDADLLFEVDQDAEVMKFISDGVKSTMKDIKETMIPRLAAYRNVQKGWGIWQVNIRETNEYIGWVLVRPMDYFSPIFDTNNPLRDNIELGWRFMAKAWGKGYATEAAAQIMQSMTQAFNNEHDTQPAIKSYCAIADPDNTASINIMRKLGMKYIKTYTHHDTLGDWYVVYYENRALF